MGLVLYWELTQLFGRKFSFPRDSYMRALYGVREYCMRVILYLQEEQNHDPWGEHMFFLHESKQVLHELMVHNRALDLQESFLRVLVTYSESYKHSHIFFRPQGLLILYILVFLLYLLQLYRAYSSFEEFLFYSSVKPSFHLPFLDNL